MYNKSEAAHIETVAAAIKKDPLAMTHAQTLQALYLCRANERCLERQLAVERKESERARAERADMMRRLKGPNSIHPPKEVGGQLFCTICSQPVDMVPTLHCPKYQFCRWCGSKLRRA